jgi:tripeptidyl-peptidase I
VRSNGVERIAQQGSSVDFATTVANANKLLDTEFAYYDIEGVKKLRTRQYTVPDKVANYINLIHPTTYFGKTRSVINTMELVQVSQQEMTPDYFNTTSNCSTLLLPYCFRDAYGVENYTPDENSGSRIAFGSFLNNSAHLEDFHSYQHAYGIPESNFSTEVNKRRVRLPRHRR